MYIVYEYATCILAASISATILFAAYVMLLLLIEGGRILAQTLRRLRADSLPAARQTDGD